MADVQAMTALPVSTTRVRRAERSPAFLLLIALAFGLTVLPLAGLAILALGGGTDDLAHLVSTVLPGSILVTAQVMLLVTLLTGSIGVVSAWLVIGFNFPMRKALLDQASGLDKENQQRQWERIKFLMTDEFTTTKALGWIDAERMKKDYELVQTYLGMEKPFDVNTAFSVKMLDTSIKMDASKVKK